jgi:guanylate kinase
MQRRGVMLVVSSPSGAGKSTLADRLLKSEPELTMSVSVTTRKPRDGEQHGVDYFFATVEEFEAMLAKGELLESARVFSNYYGTPRGPVEAALAEGRDILFDVDWQGAAQLAASSGDDLCRVFILPPSAATLEQRLKGRGKDAPEVVAQRMAGAASEIRHWVEYDYIVVNDDLDVALAQLRAILAAERLKRRRQLCLADFVDGMLQRL